MLTTGPALYRLLLLVKKSRRQGSRTVTRFLINDFAFFVRSVQIEISASTFPIVRYFAAEARFDESSSGVSSIRRSELSSSF